MSVTRTIGKALVIGGGIAGPVTALALHRAGIEAVVYEAYGSSAEGVGGTFMIASNGLAALADVGLETDVAAIGQAIDRMIVEDGGNGVLAEFPEASGRVMRRAELYAVLQRRLEEEGIPVRYGKRLAGVEERATGVTARFADGTAADGDLLIGADGTRSVVRGLIDPAAPGPRYTGLIGVGGYSAHRLEGPRGAGRSIHFAQGARAFFGYWALPGGAGTTWFSNIPQPEQLTAEQARAVTREDWLALARERHAEDLPAREVLAAADEASVEVFPRLEIMPSVPHWYRDRMVLVGDSVHAPSNSSGQGVSLAVESAVELARRLAGQPDAASALAAYETARRPVVEAVAARAAVVNDQKAGAGA
ncbi:FAD-dependent oxidoreductase [Kitasatospora sp. NPDC056651]|uniref:FAD-dependent oxidoreductase n=1 Tax=Kitasatospora sp. NPDC056651 TaxID=3345892 RepID=UPI0036850C02